MRWLGWGLGLGVGLALGLVVMGVRLERRRDRLVPSLGDILRHPFRVEG